MSKHSEYEPAVIYTNQSRTFQKRNRCVDMLAILFGVSSCIGLAAAYTQWILIGMQPIEPLHTLIIITAASVITLFYVIHQQYATQKCNETRLIYIVLACNCLTALAMAFFHRWTIQIGDTSYYLAYLICTFLFALIATMSYVLFIPWMGRLRECYLIAFIFGQSLYETLPFALRCIQGVTNASINYANIAINITHPMATLVKPILHFSSEQYFFIIFAAISIGSIAFIFLDRLRCCRKERAPGNIIQGNEYYYSDCDKYDIATGKIPENVFDLSVLRMIQMFVILICIGFLMNVFNPIMVSLSASPYGQNILDITLDAITVASPIGAFLALVLPHTSIGWVENCCGVIAIILVAIVHIAMKSPVPPFVDTFGGSFLIVCIFLILFKYEKFIFFLIGGCISNRTTIRTHFYSFFHE